MTRQLQMFDPRDQPVATAAMLEDSELKSAIQAIRIRSLTQQTDLEGHTALRKELERREPNICFPWPYVEHLIDVDGRPAWAVDDGGTRYVVVNGTVWRPDDLAIADLRLRKAALEAFARLDEIEKQGVAA
jgi:hypothetical protein